MPFIELPNRHNLRLHYLTNPDDQSISHPLDFSRHTIVFLHAGFSSVEGFVWQARDARLKASFNLVFLDSAHHGLTTQDDKEVHTIEDSADDLVAALRRLEIPAYTIFAEGVQGVGSAIWVAQKEPEKVKGVLLASPAPLRETPEVHDALYRLVDAMSTNKDGKGDGTGTIESEAQSALGEYMYPLKRLKDVRVAGEAAFQRRYGTGKSGHDMRWVITSGADRVPPSPEALASITCPVLLLSGTEDKMISPRSAAEEYQAALTGAKGGAVLHEVSGAPHLMSLCDYSVVNRLIAKFAEQTACA